MRRFCSEEAHEYTDVRPKNRVQPVPAHKAQVESTIKRVHRVTTDLFHAAYIILIQIDDVQCYTETHPS